MPLFGDDFKKTAREWRWEEDGLMSHFDDDDTLYTRDEWLEKLDEQKKKFIDEENKE